MGNPVGSLEVPLVLRARKRLSLELTQRQKEILIGCILGDAYISPLGKIRIEQSTKQREYVDWKYQELRSLCYPARPRDSAYTFRKGTLIGVLPLETVFQTVANVILRWKVESLSSRCTDIAIVSCCLVYG
jgi:hypothetical protein